MDPSPLHPQLLHPPILHILRAAGFTSTRPSVLDTLTSLTSRHLQFLCTRTSHHSQSRHPTLPHQVPSDITLTDVRMAMQDTGLLYPSVGEMEEQVRGEGEDMRGVEAFVGWCIGEGNKEIRRAAGMAAADIAEPSISTALEAGNVEDSNTTKGATALVTAAAAETGLLDEERNQDFLTRLKRKHAKTRDGEESRYAGTILGRDKEVAEVRIEGWDIQTLEGWGAMLRAKNKQSEGVEVVEAEDMDVEKEGERRSESSSPLSEISGDMGE